MTLWLATVASAQPTLADERTLHDMAAHDRVADIARAVNAGVPVDVRNDAGRTALHVAAATPHLFAAMMLVAKGADPNARDAQRRTPLHLAASGDPRADAERFQLVKMLVAKGADVDAVDADGKRPVDYARVPEIARVLAPRATSRAVSRRR